MAFVLNVAFQWKFNALICPNYWVLISTMRSQSSINRFPFLLYLEKCLIPDRAILGVRCENSFALPTNICKVLYVQILWVFQFKQGKKGNISMKLFSPPPLLCIVCHLKINSNCPAVKSTSTKMFLHILSPTHIFLNFLCF